MNRRNYLKTVGSTAVLPMLADRVDAEETVPQVKDVWWQTGLRNEGQVMTVTTTLPADRIKLRRYAFNDLSSRPEYERVTDTKHRLVFDSPTSIVGLHEIVTYRDGNKLDSELLDLDVDLLTRHITVRSEDAAQVVVRQRNSAPVAALNRAIVTGTEQQPDWSAVDWHNSKRYVPLLPETTSYIQGHATNDAISAMQANQSVWVWLQSETGAWLPSTVDFTKYDPVELFDLHGVTRH